MPTLYFDARKFVGPDERTIHKDYGLIIRILKYKNEQSEADEMQRLVN